MLGGLIICTIYMLSHMGISVGESFTAMHEKGYTQIFGTDPMEKNFFIKQVIAGAFITITMTGIDQEMMQKSLSVTNLKDSQKYVKPWIHYVGSYRIIPLYGRIITSVWSQRTC